MKSKGGEGWNKGGGVIQKMRVERRISEMIAEMESVKLDLKKYTKEEGRKAGSRVVRNPIEVKKLTVQSEMKQGST